MFERELNVFRSNQNFAHMLLDGVEEAQWNTQPYPGANTPTWIVGHLIFVCQSMLNMLEREGISDFDFSERFGNGSSIPLPDDANFDQIPKPAALRELLDLGHARVIEALPQMEPAFFSKPNPHEALASSLPTTGDLFTFLLTMHESIHLGQLSAWRRAMGLPSAL